MFSTQFDLMASLSQVSTFVYNISDAERYVVHLRQLRLVSVVTVNKENNEDKTDLRSTSLVNRNHLMAVCIDGSSGTARICLSDEPRGNLGRAGIQRVYGPTVR